MVTAALCRDCGARPAGAVCTACGGRVLAHPELDSLSIAHVDCDAFFATVEIRDNPALKGKPVVVGGGSNRGVVSAASYEARQYGIRSAMPVFKARRLCPDAIFLPVDMPKYQTVGRQVRAKMRALTPLVEPLSIDEAFLDLTGTDALHHGSPAETLARLAREVEAEIGITLSVGLSYCKFLAKVASDLDKPRGFAVIGRAEVLDFLTDKPVGMIFGVGPGFAKRLAADGLETLGQVRAVEADLLEARYGGMGRRLHELAWGQDERPVSPHRDAKSISAETTFDTDLRDPETLAGVLWRQAEKVAARLKEAELSGGEVTLKLKAADFKTLTRSVQLDAPTALAEVIYRAAEPLLKREAQGRAFRLLGVGVGKLGAGAWADPPALFDDGKAQWAKVEGAVGALRAKFGKDVIGKGRGLKAPKHQTEHAASGRGTLAAERLASKSGAGDPEAD